MNKIILASFLLATSAFAADTAGPTTLWKQWYLYRVNGKAQGYFEEVMERRPAEKNIAVTQRWVESDGGRTETYIGSVAQDDKALTPVAFFSERKGPGNVYKIDGRVKSGKLDMTFKPTKPKAKDTRKSVKVAPGMVLSNFLPMLLSRHDAGKGPLEFSAVVEDARDGKFDARSGRAEVFGVTKTFKGTSCRRAVVEFAGLEGEWWFSKEGMLCDLHIPSGQSSLEMTTEADAKKALAGL